VLIKPLPYRSCLVFLIPIQCPLALVELVYKGLHQALISLPLGYIGLV
jgi:hypothetical protein